VSSGSRRQRRDAARNHDQVLAAARELLRRQGLAADVREIARHAGVGVATLYRHFPTKDDLVRAAVADDLAEWSAVTGRAAAEADAWAGLAAFVEQTLATMARHRAVLDGVTAPAVAPEAFDACRAHLREALDGLVRRAHQQGTLRQEVSAADVSVLILALGQVVQHTGDSPDGWRKPARLVLDGLHSRAAHP
jgi:AcrR family transcriptional regulator